MVFLPIHRMYCRKYMRFRQKEWELFRLTLKKENGIVLASQKKGVCDMEAVYFSTTAYGSSLLINAIILGILLISSKNNSVDCHA